MATPSDRPRDFHLVDLGWVGMLMVAAERYGGADGVELPIPPDDPVRASDLTQDLDGE